MKKEEEVGKRRTGGFEVLVLEEVEDRRERDRRTEERTDRCWLIQHAGGHKCLCHDGRSLQSVRRTTSVMSNLAVSVGADQRAARPGEPMQDKRKAETPCCPQS